MAKLSRFDVNERYSMLVYVCLILFILHIPKFSLHISKLFNKKFLCEFRFWTERLPFGEFCIIIRVIGKTI